MSNICIDEIKGVYKKLELYGRTGTGASCAGTLLCMDLSGCA